MPIQIEKLQLIDLEAFFKVFCCVLQTSFPGYSQTVVEHFINKTYSKANFSYWLSTQWKTIFTAKEELKIIGFSVIDKPYGGVCFLRWLGVLKEFRNKGAGKKLIAEWINYAKNYGCHKVEIASQPEAKIFYEKCGLGLEGKRSLSYFGIDQYIFGKVIGQPSNQTMTRD